MPPRLTFAILGIAALTAPAARANTKYDFDEKAIVALARENTDASAAKAVAEAKRLIARPTVQGVYASMAARYKWVEALQAAGRHAAALDVAAAAIDRVPNEASHLAALERHRVRSLLALGRNDEALGHAKLFYNLCDMADAAGAMDLVVDCLRAARPDRPDLVRRFVEEQVAGAPVTRQAPPARTSVLAGIQVPDKVRKHASARADGRKDIPPTNVAERVALANLLLTADRCAEARQVFVETYPLATDGHWFRPVTEGVARALKAEDGAVGRANAWVLSQR